MIERVIPDAGSLVVATSIAIAAIVVLRPLVLRTFGAVAVLRLWWILPAALVAVLVPKEVVHEAMIASLLAGAIAPIEATQVRSSVSWTPILVTLWLTGSLAMAAWYCWLQYRFTRSIAWSRGRGSLPPMSSPAVVGALRPRLVLPTDFATQFDAYERRLVLLHERVHMRRRDGAANLLMSLLSVLQWFNPLVLWAAHALRRDQEIACDAIVIARHPQAVERYANALWKALPQHRGAPLACTWHRTHPLVKRLGLLRSHRDQPTRSPVSAALLVVSVTLVSALVYASKPVAVVVVPTQASLVPTPQAEPKLNPLPNHITLPAPESPTSQPKAAAAPRASNAVVASTQASSRAAPARLASDDSVPSNTRPIGLALTGSVPNAAEAAESLYRATDEVLERRLAEPATLPALVQDQLAQADLPACVAVARIGPKPENAFACGEQAGPDVPDAQTLFEIGSISKGLTGLLLADMVRKGEVRLDDLAAKYSRPSAVLPTRDGRQITLRHLVTHTSGLPRMPEKFAPSDWNNPYADFDADALYKVLAKTRLERDIGLQYSYSNLGYMWLSEILARAGGKPFDVLLSERVLHPLGMNATTIRPAPGTRVAAGHDAAYQEVSRWDIPVDLAGFGGVRSSLADMTKLAEALAGMRTTPLDDTITLALQPLHRLAFNEWHIAYGWFLREGGDVHHGGGTGGFRAELEVNRERRVAAIVLSDSVESFRMLARYLVEPSWPLRKKLIGVPLAEADQAAFVGSYRPPSGSLQILSKRGALYAQVKPYQPAKLHYMGSDRFALVQLDGYYLHFTRAADGSVTSVTMLEGMGQRRVAQRVAAN